MEHLDQNNGEIPQTPFILELSVPGPACLKEDLRFSAKIKEFPQTDDVGAFLKNLAERIAGSVFGEEYRGAIKYTIVALESASRPPQSTQPE